MTASIDVELSRAKSIFSLPLFVHVLFFGRSIVSIASLAPSFMLTVKDTALFALLRAKNIPSPILNINPDAGELATVVVVAVVILVTSVPDAIVSPMLPNTPR